MIACLPNWDWKGITLKINNRKILAGLADLLGASKQLIPFTTSLDKLDKIGREGVEKELVEKGFDSTAMKTLSPFFEIRGTASEKLERLQEILRSSPQGLEGEELNL